MPVVMCRSCTFQKSSFSPRLDRNKTVCIICGAFVFPNNKQVRGHYCMSHSVQSGQNKIIGKCVVCKNMVPKDKDGKVTDLAGMYGQLCMHCSLGFHAKQCCMVWMMGINFFLNFLSFLFRGFFFQCRKLSTHIFLIWYTQNYIFLFS